MPSGPRIAVNEYRGLLRAFALAGKETKKEVRTALREVVEPVRAEAEIRAVTAIPRIGPQWSQMRIGVTTHVVYVAPRRRGTGAPQLKRRNLAGLLLLRSMLPALNAHTADVERRFERMLGRLADQWGRV